MTLFREYRLRYLKWFLIVLSLTLATFWVLEYKDNKPVGGNKVVQKENPMVLTRPVMTEYVNEKLKMRLDANSAKVFEGNKVTRLLKLTAKLYDEDGITLSAWIVADFGEFKKRSDLLRLWGKVRIDLKDGQKLFTEELILQRSILG